MGNPAVPTKIKLLRGNPGKRPINRNEPQFSVKGLTCPRWFNRDARAEWRRLIRLYKDVELITAADKGALEAYCVDRARWMQAERVIDELGTTMVVTRTNGANVPEQRPEVMIAQSYQKLYMAAGRLLGLDPSSRSRLSVPEREEVDPFETYLDKQKRG